MGKFKNEIINNSGITEDVYSKVLEKEDREYLDGFWEIVLKVEAASSDKQLAEQRKSLRDSTDLLGRWWVHEEPASVGLKITNLQKGTKQPDLVNAITRQILIARMASTKIYPPDLTEAYSYNQPDYTFPNPPQPVGKAKTTRESFTKSATQSFKLMDLADRRRIYNKAKREARRPNVANMSSMVSNGEIVAKTGKGWDVWLKAIDTRDKGPGGAESVVEWLQKDPQNLSFEAAELVAKGWVLPLKPNDIVKTQTDMGWEEWFKVIDKQDAKTRKDAQEKLNKLRSTGLYVGRKLDFPKKQLEVIKETVTELDALGAGSLSAPIYTLGKMKLDIMTGALSGSDLSDIKSITYNKTKRHLAMVSWLQKDPGKLPSGEAGFPKKLSAEDAEMVTAGWDTRESIAEDFAAGWFTWAFRKIGDHKKNKSDPSLQAKPRLELYVASKYWKLMGEESICYAGSAGYKIGWSGWKTAYLEITGGVLPSGTDDEAQKVAYHFGVDKSLKVGKPSFVWHHFTEAAAVIRRRYTDWDKAGLSQQELEALIIYTTGFATQGSRSVRGSNRSTGINGLLRGVYDTSDDARDHLRTLILLAVSGITNLGAWQKKPPQKKDFNQFRTPLARVDDELGFLRIRKKGCCFGDLAFYSTAYDYSGGYALQGPAESKLKKSDEHPKGWKPHVLTIFLPPEDGFRRCAIVEDLSYFGAGEKEMLFRPGTWFKVIHVFETGHGRGGDAGGQFQKGLVSLMKVDCNRIMSKSETTPADRKALSWFFDDAPDKGGWVKELEESWTKTVGNPDGPFNWMGLKRVYIVRPCEQNEIPPNTAK